MVRVIGIDPSLTSTGFIAWTPTGVVAETVKAKKKDHMIKRQRDIVLGCMSLLRPGDIVVFEEFGVSARYGVSGRFVERVEMCGMLKLLTPKKTGNPFLTCQPKHLKMFATGNSSAQKVDVKAAMEERLGITVRNFDEADAAALALIGATLLGLIPFQTQKQQKAVDGFRATEHNAPIWSQLATGANVCTR